MSDPSATVMLWTLLLSVGLAGCAVPPAPRTEEVVVTRPAVTPSAADAAPPDRSRAHDDRALGLVAPVAVHPRSKAERISVVVNRHLREIQACYERELLTNPNLEGKVVLQPSDNEQLRDGDLLIAAGKDTDLRRLPGVGG